MNGVIGTDRLRVAAGMQIVGSQFTGVIVPFVE